MNLHLKYIAPAVLLILSLSSPIQAAGQQDKKSKNDTIQLKAVTIIQPKYGRFSDFSSQSVKMSALDVVTNPAAMGDILGNMRVLPGVQTNDNDGRLIIQGGDPYESQVYINDLIILNPYSMTSKNATVRSQFSPDLFQGITLQSGGFNAEFGQALSGIINLNTLEKEDIKTKTDLGLMSIGADAAFLQRGSSYAYRGSMSYTNLTPYGKLFFADDYDWHHYPEKAEADFFLTKEFSHRTKMTAQIQYNYSDMNYSFRNVDNILFNQDLKESYFLAQVNLYHAFNPKWNLSLAGNFITDKRSGTDINVKNDQARNSNSWNHNKLNLQYKSGILTNRSGVEFIHNPLDETYTLGQDYRSRFNNDLAGLYNDTKLLFNRHWSLSLGVRGEYSTYLKKYNFSPRVYTGYKLNTYNLFSFSFGNYYQLPSLNYLKLSSGLNFTSAQKATFTYNYVKGNSKLQFDTYYKNYKGLIGYDPAAPFKLENSGSGQGWGTNIFWKGYFKSTEFWTTYSFNDTHKKYDKFQKEIVPPYLSKHSFNLTAKHWIAPLQSLFSASYNISSGNAYYSPDSPYSQLGTTPIHNRLDLSWSFLPKPWIVIHGGCTNVLGTKNIYGYEFSAINPGMSSAIYNPNSRFFFVGLFITFSPSKKENQLKSL